MRFLIMKDHSLTIREFADELILAKILQIKCYGKIWACTKWQQNSCPWHFCRDSESSDLTLHKTCWRPQGYRVSQYYDRPRETKAQSLQWQHPSSARPKESQQVLLTVFLHFHCIAHRKYIPDAQSVTKQYYQDILCHLCATFFIRHGSSLLQKNSQLHHNNSPAHSSHLIENLLRDKAIEVVYQTPYHLDVTSCLSSVVERPGGHYMQ